jgi:hypothetical protein
LNSFVDSPNFVKELDWIESYPSDLRTPRCCLNSKPLYPQVQKYCLVSAAASYTDFHFDFGGSSVWYTIVEGRKLFIALKPIQRIYDLYYEWQGSTVVCFLDFIEDQAGSEFLCENTFLVELCAGETLLLPGGWIHAVLTVQDSFVFGGNFLHLFNVKEQLDIRGLEKRLELGAAKSFPFFDELHFFTAVSCVMRLRDQSQTSSREFEGLLKLGQHLKSLCDELYGDLSWEVKSYDPQTEVQDSIFLLVKELFCLIDLKRSCSVGRDLLGYSFPYEALDQVVDSFKSLDYSDLRFVYPGLAASSGCGFCQLEVPHGDGKKNCFICFRLIGFEDAGTLPDSSIRCHQGCLEWLQDSRSGLNRSCSECGKPGATPCSIVDCDYATHFTCGTSGEGQHNLLRKSTSEFRCIGHKDLEVACFFCGLSSSDDNCSPYCHSTCAQLCERKKESDEIEVFDLLKRRVCESCGLQGAMVKCQNVKCGSVGHRACMIEVSPGSYCCKDSNSCTPYSCGVCGDRMLKTDEVMCSFGRFIHSSCFPWVCDIKDFKSFSSNVCETCKHSSGHAVNCSGCFRFFHLSCAREEEGMVVDTDEFKLTCPFHIPIRRSSRKLSKSSTSTWVDLPASHFFSQSKIKVANKSSKGEKRKAEAEPIPTRQRNLRRKQS